MTDFNKILEGFGELSELQRKVLAQAVSENWKPTRLNKSNVWGYWNRTGCIAFSFERVFWNENIEDNSKGVLVKFIGAVSYFLDGIDGPNWELFIKSIHPKKPVTVFVGEFTSEGFIDGKEVYFYVVPASMKILGNNNKEEKKKSKEVDDV